MQRWYGRTWTDTHLAWMTQASPQWGLIWGFGTGERADKYTIAPSVKLGLAFAAEPRRTLLASTPYGAAWIALSHALFPAGHPLSGTVIGASGFSGGRVQLSNAGDGDHTITGDKAFGVQVYGYGQYTSYWYPGGLDLNLIPQ